MFHPVEVPRERHPKQPSLILAYSVVSGIPYGSIYQQKKAEHYPMFDGQNPNKVDDSVVASVEHGELCFIVRDGQGEASRSFGTKQIDFYNVTSTLSDLNYPEGPFSNMAKIVAETLFRRILVEHLKLFPHPKDGGFQARMGYAPTDNDAVVVSPRYGMMEKAQPNLWEITRSMFAWRVMLRKLGFSRIESRPVMYGKHNQQLTVAYYGSLTTVNIGPSRMIMGDRVYAWIPPYNDKIYGMDAMIKGNHQKPYRRNKPWVVKTGFIRDKIIGACLEILPRNHRVDTGLDRARAQRNKKEIENMAMSYDDSFFEKFVMDFMGPDMYCGRNTSEAVSVSTGIKGQNGSCRFDLFIGQV